MDLGLRFHYANENVLLKNNDVLWQKSNIELILVHLLDNC